MWMTSLICKLKTNKAKTYSAVMACMFVLWPAINYGNSFLFKELIKTDASFFTVDNLNNIYYLETGAIVKKEKSTGKTKHFSNPLYGQFNIIDSSDPLNILAFSSNMGIITFLDKNLVEKEPYNPQDDLVSEKPELACNSRHEGFWIYYPGKWKFLRINRKNQVLASTPPMNKIGKKFSSPCFMIEKKSRLFVSDKNYGIFVFDIFGSFLFKIPVENICTFQIKNNKIIFHKNNHLYLYDFFLHEDSIFLLPEKKIKMVNINSPYIYLLTEKGIKKYYINTELF